MVVSTIRGLLFTEKQLIKTQKVSKKVDIIRRNYEMVEKELRKQCKRERRLNKSQPAQQKSVKKVMMRKFVAKKNFSGTRRG